MPTVRSYVVCVCSPAVQTYASYAIRARVSGLGDVGESSFHVAGSDTRTCTARSGVGSITGRVANDMPFTAVSRELLRRDVLVGLLSRALLVITNKIAWQPEKVLGEQWNQ